jgi:hypothetical protein
VATATTITYQSGPRKSDKRTVLVESVARKIVLLPAGRLEILTAKLLHGQTCRHNWWAEVLGTDPESGDFAVPAEHVTQIRELGPVKTRKNCH